MRGQPRSTLESLRLWVLNLVTQKGLLTPRVSHARSPSPAPPFCSSLTWGSDFLSPPGLSSRLVAHVHLGKDQRPPCRTSDLTEALFPEEASPSRVGKVTKQGCQPRRPPARGSDLV